MADNTETNPGATTATGEVTAAAATNPNGSTEGEGGQGQGEAGKGGEGEGTTTEPGKPGEAAKPEGEAPQGAPEQYEAFTLPENYTLDGERLEMAHEFAKANNWTQEQAQEGVATYIKFREHEDAALRAELAMRSEQEFGKDFKEVVDASKRVRDALEKERPTIKTELEELAQGNHPLTLFLFKKIADLTREAPQQGLGHEASQQREATRAERMYDKSVKK